MRIASALWFLRPDVVVGLDARLGVPVDSYLNGSQTWFTGDEDTLEWRLHPVNAYRLPAGLSHYDLWEQVVAQVSTGTAPEQLQLGEEQRSLELIWDGLECFPAYGADLEPATLARVAGEQLGIPPDACGMVDHDVVGNTWERAGGKVSIVQLLAEQLRT